MISGKEFWTEMERRASLPEEVKERERPYWKEMKETLEEAPAGDLREQDLRSFVGGLLLSGVYDNPVDPFASVHDSLADGLSALTLYNSQPYRREEAIQQLNDIGMRLFPRIGRQDLVAKYNL